jgi:hypothetical protein
MKRLSWFVIGSVFGAWAMALVAQYASADFVDVVKVNLHHELTSVAHCSKEQGRMGDAAVQYAFMLDADTSSMWDRVRNAWTLTFPLVAIAREAMQDFSNEERPGADRGVRKAMLGDALERAGRHDEAEVQYAAALRLLHVKDDSGLQRLIASQARTDASMLGERERHGEAPCRRPAVTPPGPVAKQ